MRNFLSRLLFFAVVLVAAPHSAHAIDLQAAARAYAKAGGDVNALKALAASRAGDIGEMKTIVRAYEKAWADGDLSGVLKTLPDPYRKALRGVAVEFADKMDKDLWIQGRKLVYKASLLAIRQNEFLLASDTTAGVVNALPGDAAARRSNAIRFLAKLAAVAKSASLATLKNGDLEGILAAAPVVVPGVTDALPSAKAPVVNVSPRADGTVAVSLSGKEIVFVKSAGRWVPREAKAFFEGSDGGLANVRKAVRDLSFDAEKTTQIKTLLQSVNASLDDLTKATTKASFDEALQKLILKALMGSALFEGFPAAAF